MAPGFPRLEHPIIQAPLAGGPSTPALAGAVSGAGGLGFLAAGYKTAEQLREEIVRVRELTPAPFGVNLFVARESAVDGGEVARYAAALEAHARRHGVKLGAARFDDDGLEAKLALVCSEHVPIVSFAFGCPSAERIARLHDHGTAVWVTVTEPSEAQLAAEHGADALVAQGFEAGGHRGSFEDRDGVGEIGLLALVRLIAASVGELPLVAAGGIADGAGVAGALAAGARAAQIGTAFMRSPEAATSQPHREAIARATPTELTRAFTGRRARGVVNGLMREHASDAPSAYPHIHHLTAPLRAAARASGDADLVNLWAGQAHSLAQEHPAAELVRRWSDEARSALERARSRSWP